MLRRSFMSMLGLGGIVEYGIKPLLGKTTEEIDLNKIYRVEDSTGIKYYKYVKYSKFRPTFRTTNFTVENGELCRKYDLVLHNPNGPAQISQSNGGTCPVKYYYWRLNGELSPNCPNMIYIENDDVYCAMFDVNCLVGNPDCPIRPTNSVFYSSKTPHPMSLTKEQFEAEIGMTIEKLLSFN